MKRILVTGATGFIGEHVIEYLLKTDHRVMATSAHAEKAATRSWFGAVDYIPLDFGQLQTGINYYDYFRQPDLLIHLAWEGLPNYKSDFHREVNLPRHLFFLTNLLNNGLADLTVTGTCFEYGMQEGCLREDMPVFPANPYAIAKDELRRSLEAFRNSHPFLFRWLRLFYMYGRGQNPKSLLSQLETALINHEPVFNMSGGEQIRDFLPVEKVAEYIVKSALQQQVTGIINCCSGQPITVKQFVENYLHEKKQSVTLNLGYYPYPDYEPMAFWGDDHKIKQIVSAT